MKKLTLLLLLLALLGCVRVHKSADVSDFSEVYHDPEYADGFRLFNIPGDSSALMLEVFKPDTMRIVIPAGGFRRVVAMSSTYVAHLEASERLDRLVGISSPQYINSPVVKEMNIPDVGHDGAMNYEQLLVVKPELVLLYGIGGPSPIVGKLEELEIPYVYVSDFEESTPLGRAEWIIASGALVGVDTRPIFNKVKESYLPVEDSVKIIINAPYSGAWFIPGREGYMSRLIADAGGKCVAPQGEGVESQPIDSEEALMALTHADVWLCPGGATSLKELSMAVPKARFNGSVWNQTGRFYEDGAIRPDSVLAELKMILEDRVPADSLCYFYRLR